MVGLMSPSLGRGVFRLPSLTGNCPKLSPVWLRPNEAPASFAFTCYENILGAGPSGGDCQAFRMEEIDPLAASPASALALSQSLSPSVSKHTISSPFHKITASLSPTESLETWNNCEKLLLLCLRTGNTPEAFNYLQKLLDRFGPESHKVLGLRGLYRESVAEDDAALRRILCEYEDAIKKNPTNTPLVKRRVVILRTLGRLSDSVKALTDLLESSPTDVEAWSELAEIYFEQGHFSQAIFCLEEILLILPYAWNVHARMGEYLFIASSPDGAADLRLIESMKRFCRSIELCDGYMRGYCGLKLTTDRIMSIPRDRLESAVGFANDTETSSAIEHVGQLNEIATNRIMQSRDPSMQTAMKALDVKVLKALSSKFG